MQTIQILTDNGAKQNVSARLIDEDTYQFLESSQSSYCLTCGYVPAALDEIEIINVGNQEGLRGKLKDRQHFAEPNDHVALCGNCIEEMIF